jgi:hypothetical protein
MVDYNWQWPSAQNQNNPFGLVNPHGRPDWIAMQLLRSQFEDWQKTFMPIELQQMKELSFNNPDILPNAIEEADRATTGSFGAMEGAMETTNRALGVEQTQNQEQGSRRLMDLSKALAMSGAENQERRNVRKQDEAIMYGGMPNQNIQKMS